MRILAVGIVPFVLAGCITLEAPTEPIVIELNVNIRQEVIYRLAEDAGNTIEENADIF
ncbi:YnbE family lipoprotein [Qipengyuania gaetbuli]|uniref:YnbE family lipoprotein n=1 Tax=Qipengyuania gaetbuli TaxID=266952 RepID=UPI00296B1DAA|nr:YnbE family lipoprotein [Qipengyuania gaetbuli]